MRLLVMNRSQEILESSAEAVLFAAHDRFLTGATVGVDGGSVRSP